MKKLKPAFSREKTRSKQTLVRVISSFAALGILIAVYLIGHEMGIAAFACVVVAGAQYEFSQILLKDRAPLAFRIAFVFLCLSALCVGLFQPNMYLNYLILGQLILWIGALFLARPGVPLLYVLETAGRLSLGVLYGAVLPYYVIRLLFVKDGLLLFLTLLGIVFAGDIAAYFVGRKFGRAKLWEILSPKKTWAGAIGGLCGSLLIGVLSGVFLLKGHNILLLALVSALCGTLGQFGDLFESMIKRAVGVKDSGKIMPGHGGVMDRIDGLIFAAPLFYVWASYISNL